MTATTTSDRVAQLTAQRVIEAPALHRAVPTWGALFPYPPITRASRLS